jgi:hypothetical protein
MKNFKLLVFGLGLSSLALHADRGAAASSCEQQCQINYERCQVTCSQNPCIISCDSQHQYCLDSCGSNG